MGITVLEKHVTLSNKLEGPDHKSSLSVKKFSKLIKKIRKIEKKIIGLGVRKISSQEEKKLKIVQEKV